MTDDAQTFVRYREHIAARDELKSKLQELELQYARLSASLIHLPDKVDQLTSAVNDLSQKVAARVAPPAEQDHATLALHRALDALQTRGASPGGLERWLLLAMIGGAGWMAARFFVGG